LQDGFVVGAQVPDLRVREGSFRMRRAKGGTVEKRLNPAPDAGINRRAPIRW
jgi:hypothetical protein